jgi:hypothetical protein
MEEGIRIKKKDLGKYAMLALVGLLLLVSVVQAYQIASINEDLATGETAAAATGAVVQKELVQRAQAPAMVGGC